MSDKHTRNQLIDQFLKDLRIEQWELGKTREMRLIIFLGNLIDDLRAEKLKPNNQ